MHQVHASKKSHLPHVGFGLKIHVVGCIDPLRPSGLSYASSYASNSKGEVWRSNLSALEEIFIFVENIYLFMLTHLSKGSPYKYIF